MAPDRCGLVSVLTVVPADRLVARADISWDDVGDRSEIDVKPGAAQLPRPPLPVRPQDVRREPALSQRGRDPGEPGARKVLHVAALLVDSEVRRNPRLRRRTPERAHLGRDGDHTGRRRTDEERVPDVVLRECTAVGRGDTARRDADHEELPDALGRRHPRVCPVRDRGRGVRGSPTGDRRGDNADTERTDNRNPSESHLATVSQNSAETRRYEQADDLVPRRVMTTSGAGKDSVNAHPSTA